VAMETPAASATSRIVIAISLPSGRFAGYTFKQIGTKSGTGSTCFARIPPRVFYFWEVGSEARRFMGC
jgi:hypothetical protein